MLVDRAERKGYHDEVLVLVECPNCGAERGRDYESYYRHLLQHEPEDFGLGGER